MKRKSEQGTLSDWIKKTAVDRKTEDCGLSGTGKINDGSITKEKSGKIMVLI